jgi:hypothetical protein
VRVLIMALLVAAFALVAPMATAQTAGPTVPAAPAVDREVKPIPAKAGHPAAKKRLTRRTVRKTHTARHVTKGKAVRHRVPVKQTALSLAGVARLG